MLNSFNSIGSIVKYTNSAPTGPLPYSKYNFTQILSSSSSSLGTNTSNNTQFITLCCSSTGSVLYIFAAASTGYIYKYTLSGSTLSYVSRSSNLSGGNVYPNGLCCDSTGNYIYVAESQTIYSSNGGSSYTQSYVVIPTKTVAGMQGICFSRTNNGGYACTFLNSNYGIVKWSGYSPYNSSLNYKNGASFLYICCSDNLQYAYAGDQNGYIWKTSNTGSSWSSTQLLGSAYNVNTACDSTGQYVLVTVYNSSNTTNVNCYYSSNYGASFSTFSLGKSSYKFGSPYVQSSNGYVYFAFNDLINNIVYVFYSSTTSFNLTQCTINNLSSPIGGINYSNICFSSDCTTIYLCDLNGNIYQGIGAT